MEVVPRGYVILHACNMVGPRWTAVEAVSDEGVGRGLGAGWEQGARGVGVGGRIGRIALRVFFVSRVWIF